MPNTTAVLMHIHYKYRNNKKKKYPNPASTVIKPSTLLPAQDIFLFPLHICLNCSPQTISTLSNYPKAPTSAAVGGLHAHDVSQGNY